MKNTLIRNHSLFLTLGCLAVCATLPALGKVREGVDTLVNFDGKNGSQPQSILEDSAGHFYGTTLSGGKYNKGTVFEILGSGRLVTLVHFDGANGAEPEAGMLLAPDGSLYGTTKSGGANDKGTVFRISPKGIFSTILTFDGSNGSAPDSGLLIGPDGSIYGSTQTGGSNQQGLIFKVSPTGKGTVLTTFGGINGSNPGTLIRGDDGNFYGICNKGGATGNGLIFKVTPTGQLTALITFDGKNGAHPVSGLTKNEDGDFYGATSDGGKDNLGTVFKLTKDGKFRTVAFFNGANGSHPDTGLVEWSNGYFYMIGLWNNMLVKSGGPQWAGDNFCGTTSGGGANGIGTIYRVGDDGDMVTLVSFTGTRGIDVGASPNSLVPGLDGNLYGTTGYGGYHNLGSAFRLQLQLWILPVAGSSDGSGCGNINLPIVSN
jgi:uncharacterized repeat protein (TIGR03803 family)